MTSIRDANLNDPSDALALVEILDSYAVGPFGQNAPIAAESRKRLAQGLVEHASSFVLFACEGDRPVGTAVCFWGFSTFAAQLLINVHDLAVLPDFQGQGIGRELLKEVERRARERNGCKVTLEVDSANDRAKGLYASEGFGPWGKPTLFVAKRL